jgi:hypothetical protein
VDPLLKAIGAREPLTINLKMSRTFPLKGKEALCNIKPPAARSLQGRVHHVLRTEVE